MDERTDSGEFYPGGDRRGGDPIDLTFDDAVTRTSARAVKGSGIWAAIWGALASLPSGFKSLYDWCVAQLEKKLNNTGGVISGYIKFTGPVTSQYGIQFSKGNSSSYVDTFINALGAYDPNASPLNRGSYRWFWPHVLSGSGIDEGKRLFLAGSVPKKTSDLVNDGGGGGSPFATVSQIPDVSGKASAADLAGLTYRVDDLESRVSALDGGGGYDGFTIGTVHYNSMNILAFPGVIGASPNSTDGMSSWPVEPGDCVTCIMVPAHLFFSGNSSQDDFSMGGSLKMEYWNLNCVSVELPYYDSMSMMDLEVTYDWTYDTMNTPIVCGDSMEFTNWKNSMGNQDGYFVLDAGGTWWWCLPDDMQVFGQSAGNGNNCLAWLIGDQVQIELANSSGSVQLDFHFWSGYDDGMGGGDTYVENDATVEVSEYPNIGY